MSSSKVLPIQRVAKRYLMFQCRIEEPPPPFGLLDDSYDAWNNTSSQYDWPHGLSKEQWGDLNWGLLHHSLTWTEKHHDADGKIVPYNRRTRVQTLGLNFSYTELSITMSLLVEFIPYIRQSPASLEEHLFGRWPLCTRSLVHYKRSLASFLLMVLDPISYIPMHRRAYGFPMGKDEAAEKTARLPHVEDLETFLAMGAALSDPGEKISLSVVLNKILQEEKKKWEEEEE
ncbi:hypothetical protein F5146DRAFT_1004016 [Armillaria mellea]|nr:hypothetical protein F5146DRAFT_1004016 [Armillaria mellea]